MSDHDPANDWYDYVPPNEAIDHNPRPIDHNPSSYAALYFDLTDPEGERRLRECIDAPRVKLVLWEFDGWLRTNVKYGVEQELIGRSAEDVLEDVRCKLFNLCDDYNVNLED